MGGCCCHNNDATEEDDEEKCIVANNEEPEPLPKGYGSLSTVEDKHELQCEEHEDTNCRNIKESLSTDELRESVEHSSDEQSSTIDIHVSQSGESLQPTSEGRATETGGTSNPDEPASDEMSQGDVDREIDELVAAAMAAKVVYPPSTTLEQESSLCQSPEPSAAHEQSIASTQDLAASDQDEDSQQEATPTKGLSLIKKTQLSFKRAKARAASMVSMPSKSNSGEQNEKQNRSLEEKRTFRPDKKKLSIEEKATEGDAKKPLYAKRNSRESQTSASKAGTAKTAKRKKGFPPGERMKSHYAKDRVAQFEVERDVREKMASHKSSTDPRKAALERGERLGQLDDTIQDMRDHSSSFAQVARQLRDEQRGRTSTFPW